MVWTTLRKLHWFKKDGSFDENKIKPLWSWWYLTEDVESDKEAPDWLGGDLTLVHPAVPGLEVFDLKYFQYSQFLKYFYFHGRGYNICKFTCVRQVKVWYDTHDMVMRCIYKNRMELNIETFPFIFRQSPFSATNSIYLNVVCNR